MLSASPFSATRVDLSWGAAGDNVAVTGYHIERCQGAGCTNFAQIATVSGSTLSYSDTGLSASTSYSYRVRANDAAGNLGNYSNTASATTSADSTAGSDDFNRADGGLGANWTGVSDGGLSISSQAVVGSSAGVAGDIWTGQTYASDQYSQVEVTSTQLTGGQWIGPAVRAQNGGQDTYLGIYFWNNGSPQLRLYERSAGTWTQLGGSYNSGPLAAGTQLQLIAVGSKISFLQNGVTRIAVSDNSLTGGAPGIIAFGAATGDNWSGGTATSSSNPGFQVDYQGTDANGVATYNASSPDNGWHPGAPRARPDQPCPWCPPQFPLRASGRGRPGYHLRGRVGDPPCPQCTEPVQPDHHRAFVRDRTLVRGQSQRRDRPIRNVHDQGSRAVGDDKISRSPATSKTG